MKKLTEEQKREVCQQYQAGVNVSKIMEEFGISRWIVSAIRKQLNISTIKRECRRGINGSNYKGGKPHCADCGIQLSHYGGKRCKKCWDIAKSGKNSPYWNRLKCVCQYPKCNLGENGEPMTFDETPSKIALGYGKYCCPEHADKDHARRCSGQKNPAYKGVDGWVKQEQGKHFCQCGRCNLPIIIKREHYSLGIPKYLQGHGSIGENNWHWKGGIKSLYNQIRDSKEYTLWRLAVFTRDNFTCQECGDKTGSNLNAHHLKEFSKILEENNITTIEQALVCKELWDIDNGITLCEDCHIERHKRQSFIKGYLTRCIEEKQSGSLKLNSSSEKGVR